MRKLLLLLFISLSLGGNSQDALPPELEQAIRERIAAGYTPSFAIGIVDADGMRYYNYGLTREGGKPVNEHSIYEIGSVSKVFTGILLAEMALEDRVNIDSTAQKYLPDEIRMPTMNGRQITLGELSDHSSALPRMPDNFTPADPMNPYADYTVEHLYAFLNDCDLSRDIGSEYEYSNLGQGLLGHILARVADTDYETLMQLKIATPLGMHETAVELSSRMRKHLAYGHARGVEVSNWDIPTLAGAGGIRSSVHDMLRFVAANLGVIESQLYPAMVLSHEVRHDMNGSGVGLGWQIATTDNGPALAHGGRTGGYTAFIGLLKSTGTGVVVLTNGDADIDDIGLYLLGHDIELETVRPHIALLMRKTIDAEGTEDLLEKFEQWKVDHKDEYDFSESDINSLGYYYLSRNNTEAAKAIFKINTIEYPSSWNVWDSFAEALMIEGDTAAAIEYYQKSIAMNPGNTNGIKMLKSMGVDADIPEVEVSRDVLEEYVGEYELAPGFMIEVTLDGDQLKGQATGQPEFDMFPSSETSFYLKVVDAQVEFNRNTDGEVVSLTLFQNGQVIEGTRLK